MTEQYTVNYSVRSACTQSCPTLCNPMDHSLPGSSVHGIFQAKILEWVAISFSGDLPNPGTEPTSLESPALAGGFFTTAPAGKPPGKPPGLWSTYHQTSLFFTRLQVQKGPQEGYFKFSNLFSPGWGIPPHPHKPLSLSLYPSLEYGIPSLAMASLVAKGFSSLISNSLKTQVTHPPHQGKKVLPRLLPALPAHPHRPSALQKTVP